MICYVSKIWPESHFDGAHHVPKNYQAHILFNHLSIPLCEYILVWKKKIYKSLISLERIRAVVLKINAIAINKVLLETFLPLSLPKFEI